MSRSALTKLLLLFLFGVAFAFVESSVVVYLRALHYPGGFGFPLTPVEPKHLAVEVAREAATVIMLAAVAAIGAKETRQWFAAFLVAFGVWDIFYYVWLKVLLDWPATFADLDVLFLLPLPWIGPVYAPILVSLLMVVLGVLIMIRVDGGRPFRLGIPSWALGTIATLMLLYSFMRDTDASLHGAPPLPYQAGFLMAGLLLYLVSFLLACRPRARRTTAEPDG